MDGKFEISMKTPEQKGIVTSCVTNQFGTWNATLDFDWNRSSGYESMVLLSLVSSVKIDAKVFEEVPVGVAPFNPEVKLNKIYFANQLAIAFEFQGLRSQDLILSIDASVLPLQAPAFPSSANSHEEMLESGKYADVTIKTMDGKEIMAQSWILSRSRVFDMMLNKHDTKKSREKVISIDDVAYDLMKEFLRFMYCDKTPKLEEMAKDLLALGDRYEVPGLVHVCGFYLIEKEDLESVANILIPADNMKISGLKQAAIHFAVKNRLKVLATEGWKRLKENHKTIAIEIMELHFARE